MTRSLLWSVTAFALLGAAAPPQEPEASLPNDIPDNMQAFREDVLGNDTPEEARAEARLQEPGAGGSGREEQACPEAPSHETPGAQQRNAEPQPLPEAR